MSQEVQAFATTHQMIAAARQKASQAVWDYITGAAETETTMRRNRHALDCLTLRPRVLRDVSDIDAGGSLLGHRLRIPVVLGANAVGLGRLQAWALAAGGQAGLARALEILEAEIKNAMGLVGVRRLDELNASYVKASRAVTAAHELGALPFLPEHLRL
jgi:isopentenyl diphosphate isomerase/L-lactate dehydrogenase-like FMN-dependent dehydrogenase